MFLITSPFNFRIHAYPDDYWRMTPHCLRRLMAPYGGRLVGFQGHHKFPHTVMALGAKAPTPADFSEKASRLMLAYRTWLQRAEANAPWAEKVRRTIAGVYRSKGERLQLNDYYKADFTLDGLYVGLRVSV